MRRWDCGEEELWVDDIYSAKSVGEKLQGRGI
jgi:hypothetical protein